MSSTISKDEFVRRLEAMAAQDRRAYAPNQFPSLMLGSDWWEHFLRHAQAEGPASGVTAGRMPIAPSQVAISVAKALSSGGC